MLLIGLTGSIGMGKSTAAKMFADAGVPVHDSDEAVHRLYAGAAVPLVESAFPGTTRDDAIIVAERIRVHVEKAAVPCDGENLGVTISLGVAEFKPGQDRDNKSLIERADKALYLSKATGRNRVSFL